MLAIFLTAVLNAALEGLPLKTLLEEASLVVVDEAVDIHELDGTSVEEVRILRTIKGAAPADRLYYAPPAAAAACRDSQTRARGSCSSCSPVSVRSKPAPFGRPSTI